MNVFNKVEEYREPIAILDKLTENKVEMTESELGFLCGLLRDKKPKKIVEVGIAAGGSSCVVVNCLNLLGHACRLFSVDLSETYYRDKDKETGYLLNELKDLGVDNSFQTKLYGKVLAERLEEIGEGIDFLILDTVHRMPGEVVDFIAAYPYLEKDAIVVVHDTILHCNIPEWDAIVSNTVLLQTVTADKYVNNAEGYPNIGAFKINADTEKYMGDLFLSLIMPWGYLPSEEQNEAYKNLFGKKYPKEYLEVFSQAEKMNKAFLQIQQQRCVKEYFGNLQGMGFLYKYKKVYLYGAGFRGTRFLHYMQEEGLNVSGFVISDEVEKKANAVCDLPVYRFSDAYKEKEEAVFFLTMYSPEVEKRLEESDVQWIKVPDKVWGIIDWLE